MGVQDKDPLAQLSLPPGFRFFPTDEELLVQYLLRKVAGHHFDLQIIGEIDLYKFDPWVLPSKAMFGEKEWYFFSPRDRKYPNGSRPNRVAGSGYWKATGTDKVITNQGRKVGIKKALVFYVGKAPKGTKTNWIMHEYRLLEHSRKNGSTKLDDWVLCRIYKKNGPSTSSSTSTSTEKQYYSTLSSKEHSNNNSSSSSSSHLDDMLDTIPEINDQFLNLPRMNSLKAMQQLGSGNFDWASLLGMNSMPENNNINMLGNQETQIFQGGQQQQLSFNNVAPTKSENVYVPSIPPLCHVESPTQKVVNNEKAQCNVKNGPNQMVNTSEFLTSQSFGTDPMDQFGFRYPAAGFGFGLRQ